MNRRDGLIRGLVSASVALVLAPGTRPSAVRRPTGSVGPAPASRNERNLGPVLQPVGAVVDDALAGLQPREDHDPLTIGRAELYLLHRHRVTRLDQINKSAGGATLDRRARDDIHALQCL